MPAAAALQSALFAWVLAATLTLYPAGDMFSWLARWLQWRRDGDWASYLWATHNEHRLPVIRLLVAGDAVYGGCGGVLVAAALGACLAAAWMACGAAPAVAGTWLAPMLVLTIAAAVDVSSPINCLFPIAAACVIAAVLLFARGQATGAITAALVAPCCGAWGFAAWPALMWLGWRRQAGMRWAAGLGATAAAFAAVYFWPWSVAGRAAAFSWRGGAAFLLALAGLPLSRAQALLGQGLGVLMLAAGVSCLGMKTDGQANRRTAQALIVAGLAGALFVTLGRAGIEAPNRLPVRYTILLLPLHLGVLFMALPVLRDRAVLAIAALLLSAQVASALPAIRIAAARRNVLARFYGGERDPGMRDVVFPDLPWAGRVLKEVKEGQGAQPPGPPLRTSP